MKKIFTLLFIGISTFTCKAQAYQPLLTDSVTEFDVNGGCIAAFQSNQTQSNCVNTTCNNFGSTNAWIAFGDSLFSGKTYKKITYNNVFQGLMREDTTTRKVYFIQYCNTTEDLLYNFSLTQGSTIIYTFPNTTGQMQSGTFTVDSIRSINDYKNYYHTHFYLRNHTGSNKILELIEGVGSVSHPLFLYYSFSPSMFFNSTTCTSVNFDEALGCKIDNGKRIFFNNCAYNYAMGQAISIIYDSCSYCLGFSGDVHENTSRNNISIYPNPNAGNFFIKTTDYKNASVEVYNSLGEKVYTKTVSSTTENINLEKLNAGLYIIHVKQNGAYIYRSNIVLTK